MQGNHNVHRSYRLKNPGGGRSFGGWRNESMEMPSTVHRNEVFAKTDILNSAQAKDVIGLSDTHTD